MILQTIQPHDGTVHAMRIGTIALLVAGALNCGLSLLHLLLFVLPQTALQFLLAPDWVRWSSPPRMVFISITFCALFALFAWYAFSGARIGPRLPLLRTALIFLACLYLLRGIVLLQELRLSAIRPTVIVPPQEFFFSAVAFLIGVLYAVGLRGQWSKPRV